MYKTNNHKKIAFTLVELIVSITILAILGTITMLSFSGYAGNARDSLRAADISSMRSTLNIFQVEKGFFPDPVSGVAVTYLGAEAWTQGVYGEATRDVVSAVNKTPKDPLTGTEYAYSRTWRKNEFEIGAIHENEAAKNLFISSANAEGTKRALAYIKGNYNGEILRVSTGGITYVLAVPSIINNDLDEPDLEQIIDDQALAYTNFGNLPSSYKDTDYDVNGGFDYAPNGSILAYTGARDTIISTLKTDEAQRLLLTSNLQSIYSGSIMPNVDSNIEILINTPISLSDPTNEAKLLACAVIDRGFGTELLEGGCGMPVAADLGTNLSGTFSYTDGYVFTCVSCD